MCAVWGPVRLEHLLGVAVVGRDEAGAAWLSTASTTLPEAGIDVSTALIAAGIEPVADHVRVGEVQHRERGVVGAQRLDESIRDLQRRHLGLWS